MKDDLIAKVDELMSEIEVQRQEINGLQTTKGRLNLRITELEEEMKKYVLTNKIGELCYSLLENNNGILPDRTT